MKKFVLSILSLAISIIAFGQSSDLEKRLMDDFKNPNVSTISYENRKSGIKNGKIPMSVRDNGFVKMTVISPSSTNETIAAASNKGNDLTPSSTITNVKSWGTGNFIEDGSPIMFTQKNTVSFLYGSGQEYYKETTISLLDENKNITKSITIKFPDTTQTISVLGQFSKTMFNTDNKIEFMVHAHGFASHQWGEGPISCRDTLYVVNEDGVILHKIGTVSGGRLELTKNGTQTFRRIVLFRPDYADIYDEYITNIYDTRTMELKHTFTSPNDLSAYSSSISDYPVNINGNYYYFTTNYEKPFIANGNHSDPIIEKNNKFVISLYNYSDFTLFKEVKLDLIGQADNEWSMSSFGLFSPNLKYDISTDVFNDDDKIEFVYGMSRYNIDCDCELTDYYLVNEDNVVLKELYKEANGQIWLADIIGESEQCAFLGGKGDAISEIKMIDIPSMKLVYSFPAVHMGELLSLNFERIIAKNGYQYVFGLGQGEVTPNTVYGGIGYYNTKGELIKRDKVDLGLNAALFTPVISTATLSPYLIDTDNEIEYIFFGKEYLETGGVSSYLGIAQGDGNVAYKWEDASEGAMSGAGITSGLNKYNKITDLYVNYSLNTSDPDYGKLIKTNFYKLPLESNIQGEGTEENPYIITNAGELDMVRNNLNAFYILNNDIDMAGFGTPDNKGWIPIGETQNPFTGNFDGKNHSINNLYINRPDDDAALFGYISEGIVQNVNIYDVNIVDGSYAAGIVANMQLSKIINCSVSGNITGNGTIAGICVRATMQSIIKMCNFEGTIDAFESGAAGIAETVTTGTKIYLCYSKGSIKGDNGIGGIASSLMSDASVVNCYSTADIIGASSTGGIVGSNKGIVDKVYATGNVKASGNKFSREAGGIAGNASKGMVGEAGLSNSVAMNPMVTAPELFARILGDNINLTLANNYALSTMKIGTEGNEAAISSSDATSLDGADKTLAEMNQAFYESITWAFGNDSIAPWKMSGQYPKLWYEFLVKSVSLTDTELSLNLGKTYKFTAVVFPETAENKKVFWETSDDEVLTVEQDGTIKAVGKGNAIVTVTTDDGDYTATCNVTVNVPVTEINLNERVVDLKKGGTFQLIATVKPDNANDKNVKWESSNTEIVKVNASGVLTGVAVGSAIVKVTTIDGGFTAECNVNVVVPVTKVILNKTSLQIAEGETFQLEATVRPADATNKNVLWSSSNESVATVSTDGLVTAIGSGLTDITVTTVEGGFTAVCKTEVPVGIDEIINEVNVTYFNNYIKLSANSTLHNIMIFDISGKIVYENNVNDKNADINTAGWNNGIYIIRTVNENNMTSSYKINIY